MNKQRLRARRRMQRWDERRQVWSKFGTDYDALSTGRGHYNRAGKPISALKWARCMRSDEYRTVNLTHLGPYRVSTVWLGLSLGTVEALPVVFETMVFFEDAGLPAATFATERYADIREALHGHDRMVAEVQEVEDHPMMKKKKKRRIFVKRDQQSDMFPEHHERCDFHSGEPCNCPMSEPPAA